MQTETNQEVHVRSGKAKVEAYKWLMTGAPGVVTYPYYTGRVRIGADYRPPHRPPEMDHDARRLQLALIGRPRLDWDGLAIAVCSVAAIAAVVVSTLMSGRA